MKRALWIAFVSLISTLQAQERVVVDDARGLMWQDSPRIESASGVWKHEKGYCASLDYAGYSNWRLPTTQELVALAKDEALKKRFTYLKDYVFWSIDEDPKDDLFAQTVFSKNGFVSSDDKCNENYAICVRTRR